MSRSIVHTDAAPAAIGPYSQAVRIGDTVYISGQIPLDPESMTLVAGGFEQQARRVFDNLAAICSAAGGGMRDIAKLNIYLTDLSYFGTVNELMSEVFDEPYPARAALGVAALPKGAAVEMDAIMALPGS
jgi:reactive intermediate/imine deaminase